MAARRNGLYVRKGRRFAASCAWCGKEFSRHERVLDSTGVCFCFRCAEDIIETAIWYRYEEGIKRGYNPMAETLKERGSHSPLTEDKVETDVFRPSE